MSIFPLFEDFFIMKMVLPVIVSEAWINTVFIEQLYYLSVPVNSGGGNGELSAGNMLIYVSLLVLLYIIISLYAEALPGYPCLCCYAYSYAVKIRWRHLSPR